MKIVIPEKVSARGVEELKKEPGWKVVQLTPDSVKTGDLARELADADALIVRSAVKVTPGMMAAAPKLRVIGRAGIGVDNVDLDAATKQGIVVMNTPGGNAVSVAELTLGVMIAMARELSRADVTTRAGKWEKKSLEGAELKGKTLGILGLGRIGLEVARRARAFEMDLVAYDPFVATVAAKEAGVKLLSLDEVLAQSDYLSLHLALTSETHGLLNAELLAKSKQGVRIVNCARGELVDEAALFAALQSGQVGGAALDVFQKEPPGESPLFALPNVMATPHIAGSTKEAQERVGHRIAVQVKEYLAHGIIQNAVNVPSVGYEEYRELQPWLNLGDKLGSLLAQLSVGQARELSLRYGGELGDLNTSLLRNAVIAGLVNHVVDEKANLVNAQTIAQRRGIAVHEGRGQSTRGLARSLSVLLKTDKGELLLQGAVYGNEPRLVGLDSIDIEAPLTEHLLILRNDDVPGVIGHVGTVLGERGINIASFSLGRQAKTAVTAGMPLRAIALVSVDGPVPVEALAPLQDHRGIHSVRAVQL